MIERSEQDRRKQKQKIENDNRSITRRKEDRENSISYYFALFCSFSVLAIFFILSYIYN